MFLLGDVFFGGINMSMNIFLSYHLLKMMNVMIG